MPINSINTAHNSGDMPRPGGFSQLLEDSDSFIDDMMRDAADSIGDLALDSADDEIDADADVDIDMAAAGQELLDAVYNRSTDNDIAVSGGRRNNRRQSSSSTGAEEDDDVEDDGEVGEEGLPKDSLKKLIIGGIILLAAIVVVIILKVTLGSSKDKGSNTQLANSSSQVNTVTSSRYANDILNSTDTVTYQDSMTITKYFELDKDSCVFVFEGYAENARAFVKAYVSLEDYNKYMVGARVPILYERITIEGKDYYMKVRLNDK